MTTAIAADKDEILRISHFPDHKAINICFTFISLGNELVGLSVVVLLIII